MIGKLARMTFALGLVSLAALSQERPASRAPELTAEPVAELPAEALCPRSAEAPVYVPVRDLFAAAARYEGRKVRVRGYFRKGFERSALYESPEDRAWPPTNSVWVEGTGPLNDFSSHYVTIEGTFTTRLRGHLAMWPGSVCRATVVES